jgi:hypothetical protein
MKDTVKTRIVLAILFVVLVFLIPQSGKVFDDNMWINWALYIHEHGLGNAYSNPLITYHPIYLYVLYVYGQLMGSEALIVQNIHYLKIFTLLFDFLPVVVLCCFSQQLVKKKIPWMLLLLNIAYLYNTMIWGQVDSIHTSLIFFALLIGLTRPLPGLLLFLLAFNTKTQVIIYVPVMFLVLCYSTRNIKQLAMLVLGGTALQILILLPFILTGSLGQMYTTLTSLVDYYHNVSVGAFNMWFLFFKDAYHVMDYEKFYFLTYKQIGLILFFVSSGLTLLPLLFRLVKEYKARIVSDDTRQMLFIASGLISLYFFYFNTQMHERYSHPMLLFFFFYGVYSKNYKLFLLSCIPYVLGLESCYRNFFPIPHPKIIFAMQAIAVWYTITLMYAMYEFFRQYKPGREWRSIKNQSMN